MFHIKQQLSESENQYIKKSKGKFLSISIQQKKKKLKEDVIKETVETNFS